LKNTFLSYFFANFWRADQTRTETARAVPRSDGARGKKRVWRPHVRNWDLSEANVLHWRKYLWHYWDFSTPGELCPLVTPLETNKPQNSPVAMGAGGL